MRIIPYAEKVQRGCTYCAFVDKAEEYGVIREACPYNECPYRELDGFATYNEYLKARYNDGRRLL